MNTIILLVLTVLISNALSDCNTINYANQNMVYVQHTNHNLSLLNEPPNFNDINQTCQSYQNCCASSDSSEYLFLSLDDAFDAIQNLTHKNSRILVALIANDTAITIYPMHKSHNVVNLTSFVLQSFYDTNTSVLCVGEGITLSFSNICNVTIQTMSFSKCGTIRNGGLTINNVFILSVDNVVVQESASSGIEVSYNSTPFDSDDDDSGKLFNFTNSKFIRNGRNATHAHRESDQITYGGGINIRISIDETEFEVNIIGIQFMDNIATVAGALSYSADTNFLSRLRVQNCTFDGNHAIVHGGAVHLSGIDTHFENVVFMNNSATYTAGAVYQFIPFQADEEISAQVLYNNCSFENSYAEGSGSLLVTSSVTSSPETNLNNIVNITNSLFHNNSALQRRFFGQTSCNIYTNDIILHFENTIFSNNSATAVCIQSAMIILSGSVEFRFNRGYLGGAINTLRSLIKILSNANVSFTSNHAVFGGAIYENGLLTNPSECLFDYSEGIVFNVTFSHNGAISRGNSIYFFEPNMQCLQDIQQPGIMLDEDQVTSGATTIEFHKPVYMNNEQMNSIDLILGQFIVFNVTVQDFFNTSSFSQVNIRLEKDDDNIDVYNGDFTYRLEGFRHISLENGYNHPNLSVAGPAINNTQSLYKISVDGAQNFGDILINLKPCPLGFVYDETKQKCSCVDDSSISCDFTLAVACIKKGFWIGYVDGARGNNATAPSVAQCASLYCQNNNDNCSLCPITDTDDFCLLPQESADQCLSHRQGFLCTKCKPGYALTFGAIKCVKDSSCSHGKGIIPAFLNVIFLLFTIVLLIVVLKLDYRLSSGYLFCFIYYFSIIRHFLSPVVVGDGMLLFVSILTSVTQLNPQFLGYLQICFSTDLTILQQQAFLYFNPVVISIFVLLVIGISQYFSKYIKFADNTIVKAICLLLLLSFTALTETSFNILNPVEYPDIPHKLEVNIEPSVKYLDPSKHLPWFIIALVTTLFLVIPFTFLLLFAPLLNKCFNLNKIKPFLDEFQGCYKDKFRWMAGYYFLARLCYLIVLTAPRYTPIIIQYIVQLLSFLVLVIHMLLQPYQNDWMNFADSLLLADLVLVTLLFGSTASITFKHVPKLRITIACILILVPIIYLIVVIVVTVGNRCFNFNVIRNYFRKGMSNSTKDEVTHTSIERERSPSSSNGLREPLLDLMSDESLRSLSVSHAMVTPATKERKQHSRVVSYSIVDSPRDGQEKGFDLMGDFEEEDSGVPFKYRTVSVSSQSWLSETVSIANESL